ncbi:MAG: ATP-binding protein [Verrucomicrobiota bacterium]
MFRSFRFRLGLLSALISGLVVFAFGSMAWWSLTRANLDALDAELRHFGFRVALRTGRNVDTQRLENSLTELLGTERADHRFFALLTAKEAVMFTSRGWPSELNAAEFPPGQAFMDPQPDDTYRRPTEGKGQQRMVVEPRYFTVRAGGAAYRVGVFSNEEVILVHGANLEKQAQEMHQLRGAFLVALPGALLVVAVGAALVGWRALRPVVSLGRDMKRVSAEFLSHRLDVEGVDVEFEGMIRNYNEMLQRLQRSFQQASRFSADASHELKTPLTIMQGTVERALAASEDHPKAQDALTEVLEQMGRQRALLESLLLLSRADAGKLEVGRERILLSTWLATWTEDAEFLAEARGISVSHEIEPDVWMEGDSAMLQLVAHNMFSNAVRYNHEEGVIECGLQRVDEGVEWTIANTGKPIPVEDQARIFERFVRLEERGIDAGAGLGLSLVREIVEAHGGEIVLRESTEKGTCFQIRFLSAR